MAKLLQMPLFSGDIESPEHSRPPELPEPAATPDAAERRLALDIQRSWIVEAPAGSGKTGLLIQRFLKLLAFGAVEQPDEILAITFTRKADAEMRRRVIEQLTAATGNHPLPTNASPFDRTTRELALAVLDRDRALGWRLRENPQQLNIRTIDSVCAELATGLPLLAGSSGLYTPTNDPDALYEAAAQRTLLHMGGADPVLTADLESLLLHRDANPGDFTRLLAGMLRQREQWGELVPLDPELLTEQALDGEVRPRLTRTLERLLAQELASVQRLVGDHLLLEWATLGHALSARPSLNGGSPLLADCRERPYAPGAAAADLNHWKALTCLVLTGSGDWRAGFRKNHLRLDVSVSEQEQLHALVAAFRDREEHHPTLRQSLCELRNLPSAPYPEAPWQTVKSLCRVLRQALFELEVVFAERRSCDFTEIALKARSVLRSNTADLQINKRLKHLLVDEMQDTSASQYELLTSLTHGWDGRTRTLFAVGDPKQSIYEFRQARVERFLRFMHDGHLGTLQLGALRLTANFRSQAVLVEEFNSTFCEILPSPEQLARTPESVDVPFVAASPTRLATMSPALQWHVAEADPLAFNALSDPAAAQARSLRDTIEDYLARVRHSPSDAGCRDTAPKVAVLARNRAHLAPIIQEFQLNRGHGAFPYRAIDVELLTERPEILDLVALTRALLHPADRVAWLAVLRSPVCGLSLADLLVLTGEGSEADPDATVTSLVAKSRHLISQAGQPLLERTWSVLQQAQADLGRTPLATHVERTWRSLGADAPLQKHERANACRFLDLLHELEAGPESISLSLLNRRLRTLFAEPNVPEAPVELMTIHKAKGLEWDLVLIPALHRGSGRNTHEFLKWLEFDTADNPATAADLLLAPIQSKGEESSALSKWLTRRQSQRAAAEAKRLFYVACTRAREELHLFTTVSRTAAGALARPKADSLLQAAWPAFELWATRQELPRRHAAEAVLLTPMLPDTSAAEPLALAAAADAPVPRSDRNAVTERLPLHFDPLARFRLKDAPQLAYPSADSLRRQAVFARPEGSFAVRAFGNAIHRFLALMADRLGAGQAIPVLQTELLAWGPRIRAVLRTEGISPVQVRAEAERALQTLRTALSDPSGAWLLSPQSGARNETAVAASTIKLRADRTFWAGPEPLVDAPPTHLWIVDYKTAELGGRVRDSFLEDQRLQYLAQMQAYADAATMSGHDPQQVVLALYFPLLPALVHWPATDSIQQRRVTFVSTQLTPSGEDKVTSGWYPQQSCGCHRREDHAGVRPPRALRR